MKRRLEAMLWRIFPTTLASVRGDGIAEAVHRAPGWGFTPLSVCRRYPDSGDPGLRHFQAGADWQLVRDKQYIQDLERRLERALD